MYMNYLKNLIGAKDDSKTDTGDYDSDEKTSSNDIASNIPTYKLSSTSDPPTMTNFGWCFITPIDDEEKLGMSNQGCDALCQHFTNIVSLIGLPGVGKSTLASTIYNVMRGDTHEYFERSTTETQGCTRGMWSLNEKTKVLKNRYDKIDVLDLEGLEDEDVIHYLVVVAMTISNAILLCKDSKNPRIRFDAFKTLETGVKLFKSLGILLPKPVIYLQVPHDVDSLRINRKTVYLKDVPAVVKSKYPHMEGFEIRTFSLPMFQKDNRFDAGYCYSVSKLINELSGLKGGPIVKKRLIYSQKVIAALNNNSPHIISDMNYKLFEKELKQAIKHKKLNAINTVKERYKNIELTEKISYEMYICKEFDNGIYSLGSQISEQVKSFAYYNPNEARHNKLINSLIKNNDQLFIDARKFCQDEYDNAMIRLKSFNAAKGNKIMREIDRAFKSKMGLKIDHYKHNITFKGATYLPYQLRSEFEDLKKQSTLELIEKTKNLHGFEAISNDFLDLDLQGEWGIEMDKLQRTWKNRINKAKYSGPAVWTSGDHTCPSSSCRFEHSSGAIGHSKCGSKSCWKWVDFATNWCVCDTCGDDQAMNYVVCRKCGTKLKASIIPIR